LGLEIPFSPDGFAWLQLDGDRPLAFTTRCGADGLDLEP